MSAELVIGVLSEAWHKFGSFPEHRHREIRQWVQKRVREIREGQGVPTVVHPTLPRAFGGSWYERQPGEDDA